MVDVDVVATDAGATPSQPWPRLLPWLMVVLGGVGLVAAFALAVEKYRVLADPGYTPSCSLNPLLSCGSVMGTAQAEVFGFPNPLLGVVGFAMVAAAGATLLATHGHGRPRAWFWWALQAGVTLGVLLVHWLVHQSLYDIGALCPYCMVVWAVTIPLFVVVTLANLRRALPASRAVAVLSDYALAAVLVWYLAIGWLVLVRFWDYWRTLL